MRTRSIAVAGATALLLTGCSGGDDRTASEVLADATAALEGAGSVHVDATMTQDGQEGAMDLHIQQEGAVGSVTMDGQEVQLLLTGEQAFIQAGADFWSANGVPAQAASQFEGSWLLLPAEQVPDLGPLTIDGLVDELQDPDSGLQDEVEEGEVDGEDVLVLSTEDGATMSVLAGEDSYPVRIEKTGGDEPGVMELSRFGEEEDISAPADYIDLSELAG
jgi:hypothetical protein